MRKLFAICCVVIAPLALPAIAQDTADQQVRALFEADWQQRLQTRPEYATSVGDYRFDATLSDTSLAAARAAALRERAMLEQIRLIERERLSRANRLSYDLFVYEKELALRASAFLPYDPQPLTNQEGLHIRFAQLVAQMPFASETDYRNYLARLDALPRHIDGLIEQMREGIRTGWVAPRTAVRLVPGMLRQMRENLVSGPLGAPFRQMLATVPKPVRDEVAATGPALLATKVAPALQKLEDFMRTEYLAAARETIGASSLPGGADYYAAALARHTGTAMTAAEVHALGVREVARIRGEMRAAIARTGYAGSLTQFAAFANSDPRLFYNKPDQLLARYRKIVARASAELPRLFATLPSEQLLVKPAAPENAETQGAAYYEAGAPGRPAAFVVNTSKLDTRAMWEMETLALHEGVPGHHMQVARAHELPDLPAFRRHGWNVAFGEGWALYAETLGHEMGFYKDAFSAFGHLNAQLLRCARLVADTGIHAFGWTRQQALDYLNANTANPAADNEIEVDRYIAWPGQALGYKVGQIRIQALRDKAQAALGDKFDLRRFHDTVLGSGPLPLAILEQQVDRWIASVLLPPAPPVVPPVVPPPAA